MSIPMQISVPGTVQRTKAGVKLHVPIDFDSHEVALTVTYVGATKEPWIYVQIDGETWQHMPGGDDWRVRCDSCGKFWPPALRYAACTPGGHG